MLCHISTNDIIIEEINRRFGADFTEEDKVMILRIQDMLEKDEAIKSSILVNTRDNAKISFKHVFDDTLQGIIDTNFKFYKKVNDNTDLSGFLLSYLFEKCYKKVKNEERSIFSPESKL